MTYHEKNEADTLAWRLRNRRLMLGISQGELALLTQLSQGTISHLELGRVTCPSYGTINALARVLHCRHAWLDTGDRETAPAGFYTAFIQE